MAVSWRSLPECHKRAGLRVYSSPVVRGTPFRSAMPKTSAVFLATTEGPDKVVLVAGVSKDLIAKGVSAGNWVKEIAPVVGGGGGGKPDLAQAGGKNAAKVSEALARAREVVRDWLQQA